jgi:hypothetical protein
MKGVIIMLKSIICAVLLMATSSITFAAPGLTSTRVEIKGKPLWNIKKITKLYTAKVQSEYTVNKLDKLVSGGDLGLEYERINNGSWSMWKFFQPMYKYGKTAIRIPTNAPTNVTLSNINDTAIADWSYDVGTKGELGKLNMRFIQFKNQPKWLFLRLKSTIKRKGLIFEFTALPGGANWNIKERERIIITGDSRCNLKKKSAEFVPTHNGLVLTNRFWQENYGQLLLFEPEKYKMILSPQTENFVCVRLLVKEGESNFYFALGNFTNKSQADSVGRFLSEQANTIGAQLKTIKWDYAIDSKTFKKEADKIEAMLKDLDDAKNMKSKLAEIRKAFKNAQNASDKNAAYNKLLKLNEKVSAAALDNFN